MLGQRKWTDQSQDISARHLRDARDAPLSMYARLEILDRLLQAIDQIGSRLPR